MPSRVSKDHVRALRALHNSYARNLSSALSMALRAVIEVECTYIEQLTYGEYLASLLDPSCIGVFSMKPLKGLGMIEMNPPLVFPIIDRLLGGSGASNFYNRNFTTIEEIIITRVLERALEILEESWQRSIKLDMNLERLENNPQFVQAAATGDPVILILFDVRLGYVRSMMSLCFPFMTLQQALISLRREDFPALIDDEAAKSYRNMMYSHIQKLKVNISARYGASQVTLRDLLELQKGDIIKLQDTDKEKAVIFISDQKKFFGKPGMLNGRRAVQICGVEDIAQNPEPTGIKELKYPKD